MVDQNGEPKIHAGCFYPSNPDLLMKIWGLDDCARFCDDDPNCKGFSIGTVADISTEIGCLLATTRTDCKSTLGYKQYPVNKNLAVVGSLVEGSNTTSKDYGFTGCYSYSDKFWGKLYNFVNTFIVKLHEFAPRFPRSYRSMSFILNRKGLQR